MPSSTLYTYATAIKIAIINQEAELIAEKVTPTGSNFNKNAMNAYSDLLQESNIDVLNVQYLVSTGYGRRLFKSANETVSEITANAVGAKQTTTAVTVDAAYFCDV